MAAKTWEQDFRYPAIQTSIRALSHDHFDDPFEYPGSFCLPVAERPLVGWSPGRITLIALVLGFALLAAGAWLASIAEKQNGLLLVIGGCCSLSGMLMFFLPLKLDRQIIGWMMGKRGHDLAARARNLTLLASELSDPDLSRMKISIDGNDHVLILFDEQNHRLMIEGLGARYQVRAADVVDIAPFQFMNYLGVKISYRINSKGPLSIALARTSLVTELARQLPFLFFLKKLVKNQLLEQSLRTLRHSGSE
ncbi:MAG: hypothetical protein KDA86_14050 [Planctomycetaceae bacterium]|nr:hypothetical protein [Planctomycetaceae bacterium]